MHNSQCLRQQPTGLVFVAVSARRLALSALTQQTCSPFCSHSKCTHFGFHSYTLCITSQQQSDQGAAVASIHRRNCLVCVAYRFILTHISTVLGAFLCASTSQVDSSTQSVVTALVHATHASPSRFGHFRGLNCQTFPSFMSCYQPPPYHNMTGRAASCTIGYSTTASSTPTAHSPLPTHAVHGGASTWRAPSTAATTSRWR